MAYAPRVLTREQAITLPPTRCAVQETFLVAVERARLAPIRARIEAGSGSLTELGDAPRRGPRWSLGFDRAALVAVALGAAFALLGALLGRGESLVPWVGWLPGRVVSAATFACAAGTSSFVVAFTLDAIVPKRGAYAWCLVRASDLERLEAIEGLEVLMRLPREPAR